MIRLPRMTIALVGVPLGLLPAGLVAAALLTAGCSDESAPPTDPDPDPDQSGIPVELTDPAAVIESVGLAWEGKDHAAMAALLAPDFAFFIRDDEALQFPWMTGPSWDRDTELALAAHMFDPAYVGANPPVQSIQFDYSIFAASEPQPGEHELGADAVITVLTGPADGWSTDTRFMLQITEQPDGFLRLREMREVLKLEPGRGATLSAEQESWGAVKSLYR